MTRQRINDRYELERRRQLRLCSKDVRGMVRLMLNGKDRKRMADALGVMPKTFDDKVAHGRFTAAELLYLASLCGYKILPEAKPLVNGMDI